MPIVNDRPGPCTPCKSSGLCRRGYACRSFKTFVETGRTVGDREPTQAIYVQLYAAAIGVDELHRYWRRLGAQRASKAMRGEVQPLTKKELQRRWRKRERVLFEVDPARRERHLERKRRDAMRRERARGRKPLSPEVASARVRLSWERRRQRAAAAGLTMSAIEVRELREQLSMTQRELAAAIGRTRSSIEHWECADNQPPPAVVAKLRALVVNTNPKVEAGAVRGGRTAPANAVMIGNATHV